MRRTPRAVLALFLRRRKGQGRQAFGAADFLSDMVIPLCDGPILPAGTRAGSCRQLWRRAAASAIGSVTAK